ncbi:MAG: SDR family oxidoreductase [Sphingomonadaceae bacterium]
MKLELQGRVALVTAGSAGIGLATAKGLHEEGARVAICGRNPERLQAAAEQMPGCLAIQADVLKADEVENLIAKVTGEMDPVEILVNNAGGPRAGSIQSLEDKDWHEAVELTLMSVVRVTRLVLPEMQKRRWGRVVNISSYGVKEPVPGLSLSNSVRMAVLGWAKTLSAQIAADNITVNTVCPGWTRTARVASLVTRQAKETGASAETIEQGIAETIPMGRLGEAEEIANLAVFLASGAASYITGTAIQVDGGLVRGYA